MPDPLPSPDAASLAEVERIAHRAQNARLDWKLAGDEPCELLDDLARVCDIARDALASRTGGPAGSADPPRRPDGEP